MSKLLFGTILIWSETREFVRWHLFLVLCAGFELFNLCCACQWLYVFRVHSSCRYNKCWFPLFVRDLLMEYVCRGLPGTPPTTPKFDHSVQAVQVPGWVRVSYSVSLRACMFIKKLRPLLINVSANLGFGVGELESVRVFKFSVSQKSYIIIV